MLKLRSRKNVVSYDKYFLSTYCELGIVMSPELNNTLQDIH